MACVSFRSLCHRLDCLEKEYEEMELPPIRTYTFKNGQKEKHRDDIIFLCEHKHEIIDVSPRPIDGFFEALGTESMSELWGSYGNRVDFS